MCFFIINFGSKTLIPWQIKPVNPPNFSLFDSLKSGVELNKTFVGKAKDKLIFRLGFRIADVYN